ncbi:MAG TPA: sialidase family protein, partial [Egibacteraceae bacterium]|nr:sialidase family protein [Egibacteraceae bacterium]
PYTDCGFGSAQPQNIRTDLEQAPDGTLHYAFHANDPAAGGTRSVLLGRSTDRGRSWETTVVHGGPKATSPAEVEVNFVQHVNVDPDSHARVYMTWRRSFPRVGEEDPRPTRPWMAISEDGGESFGEPFMMLDENTGFDAPRLIVVGERLFAFYRVSAPSEPEGAPTRLFSAVSTDQGESWEETEIASAADASEPIPAYDRDRNVFFVVWHDNRNGDLDVFFSQSADGTTWSPPARLNDDEPENGRGQYYPQLALSPGGQLHVAWYDYRDDPYPPPAPDELGEPLTLGSNLGQLQSVYYARSDDAGQTWLPNVRVNDVLIDRTIGTWNAQFFVVVPVSIAAWDDRALVSWSDTRNGTAATGTQDIYASAVTLEEQEQQVAAGSSLPLIFGSVAGALIGAGLALWAAVWVMRRTRRRAEAPA